MKFAERLFAPFNRLHNQTEFSGSGIGLSIVKRIVSRHGGRVWATSVPGEGSTFCFTLQA
ncbi:Phytochrome-like protein cph1 [compost metagenome]